MPRLREPGSFLPTLLLVFSGYLLLAGGAVWLSRQPGSIATLWYANAFAVALLWDQPQRRWPPLLAAAMLADVLANLTFGGSLAAAVGFVLPNLLEITLAAALLRVSGAALRMNESPGAFLQFIFFGALLPPLASASLGASILAWQGTGSFERGWMYWVEGAMLGAVSVLPLAVWIRQRGLWEILGERRRAFGERDGHRFAHRAMRVDERGRHRREIDLERIAVGDDAAEDIRRAARNVGQA